MSAEARPAWLFDFGHGLHAAVGGQHLAEYLHAPQVRQIPLTPAHTRGALVWRERLVPLLDLARLAGNEDSSKTSPGQPRGAIVLAYRDTPEAPLQYGALALATVPREIGVSDDSACDLPTVPAFWQALAASCVTHENRPLPILRVRQLFTQAFTSGEAPVRVAYAEFKESTNITTSAQATLSNEPLSKPGPEALTVVVAHQEKLPVAAVVDISPVTRVRASAAIPATTAVAQIPEPAITPVPLDEQADMPVFGIAAQNTSNTVLSFRRLHAITRQYENQRWLFDADRRWLRIMLVAVVVLAAFAVTWNLLMSPKQSSTNDTVGVLRPAVKDIAPGGIAPVLEPLSPAQPPK